jgi:phosphoenolpyruvate carboxykinase (ATP)
MYKLKEIVYDIIRNCRLIRNPSFFELRSEASKYSAPNNLGVLAFTSKVRARSVENTIDDINSIPEERKEAVIKQLEEVRDWAKGRELIVVSGQVGNTSTFSIKATAYVSKSYPHLALMFMTNYFPAKEDGEGEIITIDIPEWKRNLIVVDPKEKINVVLGSDYYGELKMSILRLAMNIARERGMLGVHAASKLYRVKIGGEIREKGAIIFGLSGTGKTTITMADHNLVKPEGVVIRQDDINILTMDGKCLGTENNLYVKTDSLTKLPGLMKGVLHQDSIIENVSIKDGKVDFDDVSFSSNGRAIAIRNYIENSDTSINLDKVDLVFFITRRREMPVASKTKNEEQAVAYYMLGESVITSAGTMDANQVGKPIRVPGFDPFIIEPKWLNAIRLYEFLKRNKTEVYILNTGHVGDFKVTPEVTMRTVISIVKERAEFEFDEDLNLYVIKRAEGVNLSNLDPRRVFGENYKTIARKLREERKQYLKSNFPNLCFAYDEI